jgi:hypothetical protein
VVPCIQQRQPAQTSISSGIPDVVRHPLLLIRSYRSPSRGQALRDDEVQASGLPFASLKSQAIAVSFQRILF